MYDCVWLCMTIYDYVWLCMTTYDYVWLCMTMYDCVRLYITMYDYVWLCKTIYDYVLLCMKIMTIYDYAWLCMTMYNYVSLGVTMYDFVWLCMTTGCFKKTHEFSCIMKIVVPCKPCNRFTNSFYRTKSVRFYLAEISTKQNGIFVIGWCYRITFSYFETLHILKDN